MKDLRFEKDHKFFDWLFIFPLVVGTVLILYVMIRDVIR